MRTRSVWVIPTALLAGITLALPLTTLTAQAGGTAPVAKAKASSGTPFVTLPTGDQVRLRGTAKKPLILLKPAATSGPGRVLVTKRIKSDVYVIPADAEPYLGRFLDPALFDVTKLRAELASNGRVPVRVAYRGSTPAVPGLTITSAKAGAATGYFSPGSAPAFGKALTKQWTSDSSAGWPKRSSLFSGVTKLTADLPAVAVAKPAFAMFTLTIKVIGPDGKPVPEGALSLMNVDNVEKYSALAVVEDGLAKVSVPKGDYSALRDDLVLDEATGKSIERLNTVNDFHVTGAGQTLTIDERTATQQPSVSVPKKTVRATQQFAIERTDTNGISGLSDSIDVGGSTTLRVAPAGKPKVGEVFVLQGWQLTGPGAVPAYTYDLSTASTRIPAAPRYTFKTSDLGRVDAAYYDEDAPRTGLIFRSAAFPAGELDGNYETIPLGSKRTEYLGSRGGSPIWDEEVVANNDAMDDEGFVDAIRTIKAGAVQQTDWLRGPLGAAIPTQATYGTCYACRTSKSMELGLAPVTDSTPNHSGGVFTSPDGLPVSRFRFYTNGKLVIDENDSFGDIATVPTAKATYKAVLDVDRRLQQPNQSTNSQTTMSFSSVKGSGGKLPASNWFCDLGPTSSCGVLPILQAKVALPTSLKGTLPETKSTVVVTAARIQYATKSTITKATLEVRPHGFNWVPVKLTSIGGGKYRGTIENHDLAGFKVDIRVGAADKGGSKFQQTVLSAYTVAGS